jgi:hypothetical protein
MTIYTWEEFCKPENFCKDYFENIIYIEELDRCDRDHSESIYDRYSFRWIDKDYSEFRFANQEQHIYADLSEELSEYIDSIEEDVNDGPYFVVKKELTEGKRLLFSVDALHILLSRDLLINKKILSCCDLGFEIVDVEKWEKAARHLYNTSYKEAA